MHFSLRKTLIYSLVASIGWFLLLPFPFQGDLTATSGENAVRWHWLGGLHLLERSFGYIFVSDGMQREIIESKYSYSSHGYLLIFLIISFAFGGITYLVLGEVRRSRKQQKHRYV